MNKILGILILGGLGWFSWFAYGIVDASREDAAKAEKKLVEDKVKVLEKSMADSSAANTVRETELRKMLPLIKTDNKEQLDKVLNQVFHPSEAKKEEKPAEKPVATADKPAEKAVAAPVAEKPEAKKE